MIRVGSGERFSISLDGFAALGFRAIHCLAVGMPRGKTSEGENSQGEKPKDSGGFGDFLLIAAGAFNLSYTMHGQK